MNKKIKVIIFAYGFMGKYAYESFFEDKNFLVEGIILPKKNTLYFSSLNKTKIKKNTKILESDNKNKVFNFIKKISPNLVIISTFNKILDKRFLKLSNFINIHHGKLPKQKGRASINWAIIMGRKSIYLTIHKVVLKLDAGQIIYQKKFNITPLDNYISIKEKVNKFIKKQLSSIIQKYLTNKLNLKGNKLSQETWNPSRNPEDSMINFFDKKKNVINLIRGTADKNFGAFCFLNEKKIIILDASIKSKKTFEGIIPGRIVKINKNGSVDCLCSDGVLTINKISYNNKIIKPSRLITSTRFTLLND